MTNSKKKRSRGKYKILNTLRTKKAFLIIIFLGLPFREKKKEKRKIEDTSFKGIVKW